MCIILSPRTVDVVMIMQTLIYKDQVLNKGYGQTSVKCSELCVVEYQTIIQEAELPIWFSLICGDS